MIIKPGIFNQTTLKNMTFEPISLNRHWHPPVLGYCVQKVVAIKGARGCLSGDDHLIEW
jgi:hypothetical protein